jgi:hypothetical protein
MSDMSQELHQNTDYIPPLKVHSEQLEQIAKSLRPKEIRVSHKTIVLTAANPFQQLAGIDPARIAVLINVLDNSVVLCGNSSQASDVSNTTGTLAAPNGRILSASAGEYELPGNGNEVWFSTATYPTRIGTTIVREIS